jgi:hypothetical protein
MKLCFLVCPYRSITSSCCNSILLLFFLFNCLHFPCLPVTPRLLNTSTITVYPGVSYSVMFGALIRKIFIVMRLLQSSKSLAVKVQSQQYNQICTVMTVLLMIAFDAVIIVTWSLLSPAIPSAKTFKVPFIGEIFSF